jgi:hypothetical protein
MAARHIFTGNRALIRDLVVIRMWVAEVVSRTRLWILERRLSGQVGGAGSLGGC